MSLDRVPGPTDYQAPPDAAPTRGAVDVTDIRFYGTRKGNFLCYVSAVLGRAFVLKHMRLVVSKRDQKVILDMPARQAATGEWEPIYHPITKGARRQLETAVFKAYETKAEEGSVVAAAAEPRG